MKKLFITSVTATALLLGASAAYALDEAKPYVTGSGDSRMVMDGSTPEGARILSTTDGVAPADCPAGSYYDGPDETVVACEGGSAFGMMAVPEGAMMSDGNPYPEGAMMLESRENNSGATN